MLFIYYLFQTHCNIQYPLKYNLSERPIPDGLPIYDPNETLGEAICCDERYLGLAEPRWTFNRSDVDLFKYLNTTGPTIFYDSVCGLPLFSVPKNRTLDDFKKETLEHGWLSFHDEEMYVGENGPNILSVPNSSRIISKCGTFLGDNLPEDGHNRYCLDLVCLSGSPVSIKNYVLPQVTEGYS